VGETREYTFGDITVACTNVDRVIFPDCGVTKGDMLDYYADVAEVMVPHLRERALTIERFTKGVDKGGFFQKHYQKHFPAWLEKVETHGKTPVVFPVVNDAAGLVYIANQGGVAFHVGTSRITSFENPDFVVFDLDPPEGRFDLVRRAASAVRRLMDRLELVAFVKTSGSKGLHVVVPVDGSATYEDINAFCKLVATRLCEKHADIFTTEFYKKDRGGRLFLDTLRNGMGATVVVPWSLRGKKGAPVAAPITWDEVDDPELAPNGITIRDVRARLDEGGDPWAEIHDVGGSVANAIAELQGG
jgi:bifunctional non-homologous end joining protein LigD